MSKGKLKLTGIKVKNSDGEEIELTMEEAKDLHEQLDELFGKETITITQPVYIERERHYWEKPPYRWIWGTTTESIPMGNQTLCVQSGETTVQYLCEAQNTNG